MTKKIEMSTATVIGNKLKSTTPLLRSSKSAFILQMLLLTCDRTIRGAIIRHTAVVNSHIMVEPHISRSRTDHGPSGAQKIFVRTVYMNSFRHDSVRAVTQTCINEFICTNIRPRPRYSNDMRGTHFTRKTRVK